ncbi:MAG: D-tyrosyl-tRNA(Tyr) deacylase [Chloroflexi bacterium]|nr:D-tyrosyl-tRNA(Tyr) deacylase [Chloroflexota bacterium]
MRLLLQRVSEASVSVDGNTVGRIGAGLLIFVGIASGDDPAAVQRMAARCAELRIFAGEDGRFDRSVGEIAGSALVVSQFTLLADVRKGRRPSFIAAATPEVAEPLVASFAEALRQRGIAVETGVFGAMMRVHLVNDGPVTLVIDSADLDRPRR